MDIENPQALATVKRGLRESAEGKTVYPGSFAKYGRAQHAGSKRAKK